MHCLHLDDMTRTLRQINPTLRSLHLLNRGTITTHPDLEVVMTCHAVATSYLAQFFKQPPQAPCGCKACRLGLWSPFMLDPELVALFPSSWQVQLPIPLPFVDGQALHYIPLEQAQQLPLTDEHQPSLINKLARRANKPHDGARARPTHIRVLKR